MFIFFTLVFTAELMVTDYQNQYFHTGSDASRPPSPPGMMRPAPPPPGINTTIDLIHILCVYIIYRYLHICLLGLSVKYAPSWHTNLDLQIIASSCMVPLPCTCFGFRADPFCVLSKFIYFFLSNDH